MSLRYSFMFCFCIVFYANAQSKEVLKQELLINTYATKSKKIVGYNKSLVPDDYLLYQALESSEDSLLKQLVCNFYKENKAIKNTKRITCNYVIQVLTRTATTAKIKIVEENSIITFFKLKKVKRRWRIINVAPKMQN